MQFLYLLNSRFSLDMFLVFGDDPARLKPDDLKMFAISIYDRHRSKINHSLTVCVIVEKLFPAYFTIYRNKYTLGKLPSLKWIVQDGQYCSQYSKHMIFSGDSTLPNTYEVFDSILREDYRV